MHAVLSHLIMSDSATLWTVARQAPLSMRIPQARIVERFAMPSSRGPSSHRAVKTNIDNLKYTHY